MDRQTDGRYQVHYLPRLAVDKNLDFWTLLSDQISMNIFYKIPLLSDTLKTDNFATPTPVVNNDRFQNRNLTLFLTADEDI